MEVTEIMSGNHLHQLLSFDKGGKTTLRIMKSGEGKRVVTKFRYFRWVITGTAGSSTIQFTKLKFYSSSGRAFNYWKGSESKDTITNFVTCTASSGKWGANDGERGEYGLLSDPQAGKCCFIGDTGQNITLLYDLKTPRLDLSVYRKWSWYTANDTYTQLGRNPTVFKLQVSNDNVKWLAIDQNTNASNIKTTQNWSLAYEHELDLSELEI